MERGTYYDKNNSGGIACELSIHQNSLYIYLQNTEKTLVIWHLQKVESCNYNGNKVTVIKNSFTNERCECTGLLASQIYQTYSNPVKQETQTKRPLVSYTPFLVFSLSMLGLGLLIYFLVLPWLGRQAVKLVPMQMEIQMGEGLSKQYALQYSTNDSVNIYLHKFCNHLNLNTLYPIKVEVLQSDELNAFALPGGRIFIYSGMLKKLNSYEELVALIGHESSHVTQRHSLKSIMRDAATGMVISAVFGDVSEISTWVMSRADEFKSLDYSRELETEADDEGFKIMLSNNIDPKGMLRLLEVLKKEGAEMPGMMKYLSTHPDTDARISNVQSKPEIKNTYKGNKTLESVFNRLKQF